MMDGSNAYWVSKAGVERLYTGLAADLKPDNIAVNCLSPSRVVLTEGWQAGGAGMEIPEEMVEPPEAMANAAVLLAGQDARRRHGHHPALRSPHLLTARMQPGLSAFARFHNPQCYLGAVVRRHATALGDLAHRSDGFRLRPFARRGGKDVMGVHGW